MMHNRLKGGTFNLFTNRSPQVVKGEVEALLTKHNLDFLCVQEAVDYYRVLSTIKGYKYFSTTAYKGGTETGILVRETLKATKPLFDSLGDGWITTTGKHHAPSTFARVRIDGWLRVGSVHLPTPSHWDGAGRLIAAPERKDDYLALTAKIKSFFKLSGKAARLIGGDWNEAPTTMGEWSPSWIAKSSGAQVAVPESKAGHGRIDYALYKNCKVVNIRKDTDIPEQSDHEPVVFEVLRLS